jgi:hypothetical protein
MRVAITLDDDLATMIHEEMERSGETFKVAVNRLMRLGLGLPQSPFGKLGATLVQPGRRRRVKSPKSPA